MDWKINWEYNYSFKVTLPGELTITPTHILANCDDTESIDLDVWSDFWLLAASAMIRQRIYG